jgi:hypothetical protein
MANPFPFNVGAVLTAAQMNGIGEATAYTPILTASVTNPTLGTGASSTGLYFRIQNMIFYRFSIIFGSSGFVPGVGNYEISLPVTGQQYGFYYSQVTGQTSFFDVSTNTPYFANAWMVSATKLNIIYQTAMNGSLSNVSAASPVVPANSDSISGYVIYQAA